jgi:hypothetical protein
MLEQDRLIVGAVAQAVPYQLGGQQGLAQVCASVRACLPARAAHALQASSSVARVTPCMRAAGRSFHAAALCVLLVCCAHAQGWGKALGCAVSGDLVLYRSKLGNRWGGGGVAARCRGWMARA